MRRAVTPRLYHAPYHDVMLPTWIALLLLAQTVTADAPAVPPGRVCIGEKKSAITAGTCANTMGAPIEIAPSDTERQFVWISADFATVQLGLVPAKARTFALDPAGTSTLQLSLDGERSRGWPADVTMTVGAREPWRWVLDAKQATRLRRIVVPRGPTMIQLKADHHRLQRRGNIAATTEVVNVGELRLVPLPVARGVVVDAEGKPIAGAIVTRPDASLCASVNEQGAFVCELGEPAPEALVVTSSGRGLRELALPKQVVSDVDLGRITLTEGRALTLKIVRPEGTRARVTLFHDAKERYDHSKVKTVELREIEDEARFDAGEGRYQVLIEGDGPLERLEVPLDVKDADVQQTITITPYQLTGKVTFGEEALAEGTFTILAPEHTWRSPVPVAGGAFTATMWQSGRLSAFVNSKEIGVGELVRSPDLGADPSRWDVHIEKRMIVGRVLDAETKVPVAPTEISFTADFGTGNLHASVRPDPDGSYRILANKPGKFSLRVNRQDYMAYSSDVVVTAEDRMKTHDILLERGVLQPLEIVTPAGAPFGGALILEGVQPDGVNPQFMDHVNAAGQYSLRGRAGETRLLYVVPQGGGSFAVVRVQIPRGEAKALQVVLPPAVGSLRVRTVNARKEAAPAGLLLRYNGEFIPNAILRFVTGDTAHTYPGGEVVIPRLPAGTYELWALTGRGAEAQLIASGGTLRAPVRVGLASGEQSVTVPIE
jgi:Carboxypeptidase regulatory-like domain